MFGGTSQLLLTVVTERQVVILQNLYTDTHGRNQKIVGDERWFLGTRLADSFPSGGAIATHEAVGLLVSRAKESAAWPIAVWAFSLQTRSGSCRIFGCSLTLQPEAKTLHSLQVYRGS